MHIWHCSYFADKPKNMETNISENLSRSTYARGTALKIIESSCLFFIDFTALFGNILVCLAVKRKSSLQTVTNVFVLSLAVSDILMALLVMPLTFCSSVTDSWLFGDVGIKIDSYFGYGLGGVSLTTLTLIAINRFVRVVKPTLYPSIYTKRAAKITVVLAWLVTFTIIGVCFTFTGIEFQPSPFNPTRTFPFFETKKSRLFFYIMHTGYIVLSGTIMCACYMRIYQALRQHTQAVAPTLNPTNRVNCSSQNLVAEIRTTKLLAVVLVAFYICWFPLLVQGVLSFFISFDDIKLKYFNLYYTIPGYTSSMINPIIYGVMSPQFRREFIGILRRR